MHKKIMMALCLSFNIGATSDIQKTWQEKHPHIVAAAGVTGGTILLMLGMRVVEYADCCIISENIDTLLGRLLMVGGGFMMMRSAGYSNKVVNYGFGGASVVFGAAAIKNQNYQMFENKK